MIKLIKNEFLLNKFKILIPLAIMLVVEIVYLLSGVFKWGMALTLSSSIFFSMLFLVISAMLIFGAAFFDNDITDKNKHGYMILMTPYSYGEIILSKFLTTLFVSSVYAIVYALLFLLNSKVNFSKASVDNEMLMELDASEIFKAVISTIELLETKIIVNFWLFFVIFLCEAVMIYFFIRTIIYVFFIENKFREIITAMFILAVATVVLRIQIPNAQILTDLMMNVNNDAISGMIVSDIVGLVITVGTFLISSKLGEKKLSL